MNKTKVTKKQAQADRSRVNAIYGRVANGVQVPIMSLGRIMDAGLAAVAAGGDDAAVAAAVKQAVDRVKVARKEDIANGVLVPIMSLGAIMDAGLAAIAAGADEPALEAAVRSAVDKVKTA